MKDLDKFALDYVRVLPASVEDLRVFNEHLPKYDFDKINVPMYLKIIEGYFSNFEGLYKIKCRCEDPNWLNLKRLKSAARDVEAHVFKSVFPPTMGELIALSEKNTLLLKRKDVKDFRLFYIEKSTFGTYVLDVFQK